MFEVLAQRRHAPITYDPTIGITAACAGAAIVRQASVTGDSGRATPGTLWVLSRLASNAQSAHAIAAAFRWYNGT
jgi:hypothetical protein